MKNVKPLIEKGLMNAGLVELTPTLTARYNECLRVMGIAPTSKESIFVDGVGWSPQVARERRNAFYLGHGIINPAAIIVSPEQYKKPVYFPVFSWQRSLMRLVFDQYHREIFDITATHGISLDIENGLSSLKGPRDLLLLSSLSVVPNTSEIAQAAAEQAGLIARFSEGLNCLEPECRAKLVKSREQYGDLRKRHLVMHPVTFGLFNDFYTVAFDGAAVIRGVDGVDLLVLESQSVFESIKNHTENIDAVVCHIEDSSGEPFRRLAKAEMLTIPLERFRQDPRVLDEKRDLLVGLSLCDCEEGIEWSSLSASKRKSLMGRYADKVHAIVWELERYTATLRRGGTLPELSEELWHFLAVPNSKLPSYTQEVLWILLTKKDPRNILEAYTYDKNGFISLFQECTPEKQKWVAEYLAERYVPRMRQS